jgi:hypothetical protein
MAVTFREGVALAIAPGSGSGPPNETLNPGTNPVSGDILILGIGTSNAGSVPGSPSIPTNGVGGTWDLEHTTNWGSRRRQWIVVNDDWTTASGSIEVQYQCDQSAGRVLMIAEGASGYAEVALTEFGGDGTSWNPDVGTSHDRYLVMIQMENNEAISTSSTGWSEIAQVGEAAGVRRFAIFEGDASVGGFDSTPTFTWTNSGGFSAWAGGFTAAPDILVDFEVAAATSGSSPVQTLTSGSFTPTANSKLYVWAAAGNWNHSNTKVWGITNTGGLSFSVVENPPDRSFNGVDLSSAQAILWVADVGGSPSSMTVTIDADTGSTLQFLYSLAAFCVSSDSTLNVVQTKSASEVEGEGSSESIAVTMDTAIMNGNTVVVCLLAATDSATAITIPTGFGNVLVNQTTTDPAEHVAVAWDTDISGSTITCTDLGELVGASAIAVIEFSVGGGQTFTETLDTTITATTTIISKDKMFLLTTIAATTTAVIVFTETLDTTVAATTKALTEYFNFAPVLVNSGFLESEGAAYGDAIAGTVWVNAFLASAAPGDHYVVGQTYDGVTFYVWETLVEFDTEGLSGVTDAELRFILLNDTMIDIAFSAEVYAFDYGVLTDTDWQDTSELSGLTLVGTLDASILSGRTGQWFTISPAGTPLKNVINISGPTHLLIISDRLVEATAPNEGVDEAFTFDWPDIDLLVEADAYAGSAGAPQNVVATATSSTEITVTWDAVTGATGYDIERDGVVIATDHTASPFNDSSLSPGIEYAYRVRAVF